MTKTKLPKVDSSDMKGHVVSALIYLTRALGNDVDRGHDISYAIAHIKQARKQIPKDFRGLNSFSSAVYAETPTTAIRSSIGYLLYVHEQIERKNLVTSERFLDDALIHLKGLVSE